MKPLNTRRARSIRKCYYNQVKRPYKTEDYVDNWRLLDEGLDIIWPGIINDIESAVRFKEWDRVRILLKADLRGREVGRIPLKTPADILDLMLEKGLKIKIQDLFRQADSELVKGLTDKGIEVELDFNIKYYGYVNSTNMEKIVNFAEMNAKVIIYPVELTAHPGNIQRFRDLGVEIRFKSLNPYGYRNFQKAVNVVANLELSSLNKCYGWISSSCIFSEYLHLMNIPLFSPKMASYLLSSYRIFIREIGNLDESTKTELFKRCCDNGYYREYLRHMLNDGYEPDFTYIYKIDFENLVIILESDRISKDKKYRLLENLPDHINRRRFYLHPSTKRYWDQLRTTIPQSEYYNGMNSYIRNCDVGKIREYVQSGRSYDYRGFEHYIVLLFAYDLLSQEQRCYHFSEIVNDDGLSCDPTNSAFRDLWSIVPTDNLEFLWFLYLNGIELPPSKSNKIGDINAVPRLLTGDHKQAIDQLLVDSDLDLLIFLNESKFNLRTLMGYDPKIDLLLGRYPIRNMKAAVKK